MLLPSVRVIKSYLLLVVLRWLLPDKCSGWGGGLALWIRGRRVMKTKMAQVLS